MGIKTQKPNIKRAAVIFGLLAGAGLLGLVTIGRAQTPGSLLSAAVELTPALPQPSSEVRAKVISFSFDVERASILWTLNGRRLLEGRGAKELAFEVGPVGSLNELEVTISPQEGGFIEKRVEIRPQGVDLLIEPESFTPPWYKGAAVASPGSRIRVIAIPNFIFARSRLDPKTLIYNWRIGDVAKGDLSGRGKQSLALRAPAVSGANTAVTVKVSSPQGDLAEAQTFITASPPEILSYERAPLEGLRVSEALGIKTISAGANLEIQAVPFFMNFSSLDDLKFDWSFNGTRVAPNPREPDVFLIKSAPESGGDVTLDLLVNNLKNVLEEIRTTLKIHVE